MQQQHCQRSTSEATSIENLGGNPATETQLYSISMNNIAAVIKCCHSNALPAEVAAS